LRKLFPFHPFAGTPCLEALGVHPLIIKAQQQGRKPDPRLPMNRSPTTLGTWQRGTGSFFAVLRVGTS
jgi:hypothetical protein